jgi:SAM-dependent methyltransferase
MRYLSSTTASPMRHLFPLLSDSESLRVLDALKPSFGVEGSRRRAETHCLLERGEFSRARRLLEQQGLLEYRTGQWLVPTQQARLVYQLVGARRDETETVARIAELANAHSGCRWLDIACGSGALLRTARRVLNSQTMGVDLDQQALTLASLADVAAESAGAYLCAQAHQLPFAAASFDLVTSMLAVQHFQVRASLAEIGRVLRPGGSVFLRLHGTGYYWELARKYARQRQVPVYALRCLWHGLRVAIGLPQNLAIQGGWLKFEIPVSRTWICHVLREAGIGVSDARVLRTFAGRPVFMDLYGVRSDPP